MNIQLLILIHIILRPDITIFTTLHKQKYTFYPQTLYIYIYFFTKTKGVISIKLIQNYKLQIKVWLYLITEISFFQP